MKLFLSAFFFTLAIAMTSFAQMGDAKAEKEPTEKDKTEAIPTNAFLKRGAPIGNSKKVSLSKVLDDPAKFSGQSVVIEGVVVRSCKMEGCWAEVAENKDAKSIRINMKGHAFFIPLQSAGVFARVEGLFSVKILTKAEADRMIEKDGAKFANRNADGTVNEISFEATGIELKKTLK